MRNNWPSIGVTAVLALASLTGCGERRPPTYPVTGKVTFPDGKPLAGGTVEFESEVASAEGLNARGEIQADGTFSMTTYEPDDGAIEGRHRVIVHAPQPADSGNMSGPPPAPVLHPRFRSFETSGLTITVEPKNNEYPITVTGP